MPKAESAASVALVARRKIDEMFAVDARFDHMEPKARAQARDTELKPLMDAFLPWACAELANATSRMALHRALAYAVEFWPTLKTCCQTGT
ncbi:MAG: transposase [Raoultibacter sp.]